MWAVTHVLRSDVLDLLIGLAVLVTLLVLAGLIFQTIGSSRDARRFPPPGELVNAGGHRLHIYRMGEGTPAVVMDSGFPASSLSWTFVQPALARFTDACSYDRAGLGWSDAGPKPRSKQIEVHPKRRGSRRWCKHRRVAISRIRPPRVMSGNEAPPGT
jgi:hypothetical protein